MKTLGKICCFGMMGVLLFALSLPIALAFILGLTNHAIQWAIGPRSIVQTPKSHRVRPAH